MITVVEIEAKGLGYFDSLIAAQAITMNGEVITTDKAIEAYVKTSW